MTEPAGKGNILDDVAAMRRADGADMLGHVAALAGRLEEGWSLTRDLGLPWARPASVAVLGVGGSAIAADLVRGIWADRISVPMVVSRGSELPAWVGPETLVIASSKSGATEETLRQLESALTRRCPVVAVTTGGAIRRVAEAAGLPLVAFPDAAPARASLGWSMAIMAGILERAGVLELADDELAVGAAAARAAAARCAPDVPTAQNPAKQLAWSLVDRFVIVSGSGALAPVAQRWKAQLNESSKAIAVAEALPAATHDSVAGFEQPESLRDHLAVVFLRSELDHPRDVVRAQLFGDLLDAGHIWHTTAEATGDGQLGQALSTIVVGDHVSVYLAFMYGLDPTPVEVIMHIREQLALAEQAAVD